MIEDAALARTLFNEALSHSVALDQSVATHQGKMSQEELAAYKQAAGFAMAAIFDHILGPIGRRHPELLPESWKAWFK